MLLLFLFKNTTIMLHLNRKKQYYDSFDEIQSYASQSKLPADIIALRVVKKNMPRIKKYVSEAGQIPSENIPELALQATLIHESKVASKMKNGIPSYEAAENEVFRDEQQKFDSSAFDDSYQDFNPAILGAVATVAKAGVTAINKKREEKGKKPILSGKFWNFLKSKTENIEVSTEGDRLVIGVDGKPRKATDSEIAAGLNASIEEIEKQKKKEWMKKNLPIIIVFAVIIIVGVYFLARRK